ncbi:MAG TPA: prepilin-type N-terminal cleavage/methylation domain-containing protein [Pirellulales bacterium]|nr:prepilin-type N-terminal cleavage/methylation domain-containing protein [Pirellulales bacterium]
MKRNDLYNSTRQQFNERQHRRAFTLVEMLVVTTMVSVVLSIVGVLLHGAWSVEQSDSDHRVLLDSMNRLAQQFRDDVHAAASVQIITPDAASASSKAPATCSNNMNSANAQPISQFLAELAGGRRIEYVVDKSAINRTVRSGDAVNQRETYALPPNATIGWQVASLPAGSEANSRLASLLVDYPLALKNPADSAHRQLRVDALIGSSPASIALEEPGK